MTDTKKTSRKPAAAEREALSDSEREASAQQPESYKPEATDAKIVEVKPIDRKDSAIKGLDPK
ncbi:MAG TPA: hypothetical protein VNU71_08225 [Burkholderiaceae bacterium]|nr:hypothetical protein [Burkholderiaceae bacterium]